MWIGLEGGGGRVPTQSGGRGSFSSVSLEVQAWPRGGWDNNAQVRTRGFGAPAPPSHHRTFLSPARAPGTLAARPQGGSGGVGIPVQSLPPSRPRRVSGISQPRRPGQRGPWRPSLSARAQRAEAPPVPGDRRRARGCWGHPFPGSPPRLPVRLRALASPGPGLGTRAPASHGAQPLLCQPLLPPPLFSLSFSISLCCTLFRIPDSRIPTLPPPFPGGDSRLRVTGARPLPPSVPGRRAPRSPPPPSSRPGGGGCDAQRGRGNLPTLPPTPSSLP